MALTLTVAVVFGSGAIGLGSGCKGGDAKKPDEESTVALQTPESGELPGAGDAARGSDGATPKATKRHAAPHIRTSGAEGDEEVAAGAEPAADGPATVTARTSKKLPARAAATGPTVRTPTAVRRTPTTLRPGTPGLAVADGDAPAAAGAVDPEAPGDEDPAFAPEAEDSPDDGGAPTPANPTARPAPAPAPRIAGSAPPTGTPTKKVDAPAAPPFEVDRFLPLAAVRDLVAERRIMAIGPLAGLPAAPGYNSLYYGVPGKESFGAAVQAWQDQDRRSCVERYRRMREQYPNAQDVTLLEPTKAFYSSFGAIQTLTMTDTNKRLVVSVSCGQETCTQQVLLKLAQHAQKQM